MSPFWPSSGHLPGTVVIGCWDMVVLVGFYCLGVVGESSSVFVFDGCVLVKHGGY